MKNVFNNSELAHAYSNRLQQSGRNSNGSMFFTGSTMYSYGHHFAISKFITNEQGQDALLFTTRTYSNTTAKQVSIVWSATRQHKKIHCYNPNGSHEQNFSQWIYEAENIAAKLSKARKPEIYLRELSHINRLVSEYSGFFGIEIPVKLSTILAINEKKEYLEYMAKKVILEQEQKKKELREQKERFKEQFSKWIKGESDRLYSRYKLDFLRVKDNRIETTQAVQIPLEIAKRLYNSIKIGSLSVGDKVLQYQVNEVGNEIKIGCHTFKRSYLLNFGSKLA